MNFNIKTTKKDEIVDITEKTQDIISNSKIEKGIIVLNILHTTAALSTADLDPGTDKDTLDALREIMPDLPYRHPHDPSHTPDHILSTLLGTDVLIPFENSKLVLGTWQHVVLLEFDGPKSRQIHTSITKSEV